MFFMRRIEQGVKWTALKTKVCEMVLSMKQCSEVFSPVGIVEEHVYQ